MTVAEAIIAAARSAGVEHIFGLPGSGALMDVMEAGRRNGVAFVAMAHESSAAIAAATYGHLKGTAGLAMAIKGPGAGNLAGGALSAYFERKPVVCLCETASTTSSSRPVAQVCDHRSLFSGFAAAMLRIDPLGAAKTIAEAFRLAASTPPGPVLLELPSDLGGREIPAQAGAIVVSPEHAGMPDGPELAQARRLIASFTRPALILGADVARDGALEEAASLARSTGAAVLVTMEARGVFPEDDPRFAAVYTGLPGPKVPGNLALGAADGVILAGVDALMTEAPWRSSLPTVELIARGTIPTLSPSPSARVEGSLKRSLAALSGPSSAPGYPLPEIAAIRRHAAGLCERPALARLAVQDIIHITRELLPPHGLLFSETGVFVLMLEHVWTVTRPDTFFGTSGGRSMGLMIPALLGAKLARPDLPMVGIGGDGSLLMRLGELEAYARTGASAPLVIVNDRCLGTIRARQKHRGLPSFGLDLGEVAFADVARACGLAGVTVETPDGYRKALSEALGAKTATLIDARVDPEPYRDSFVRTSGG